MDENGHMVVIIVGGGLVGSLNAIFMARRGYKVLMFEYRDDIRLSKLETGKSINLALSNRGRRALSLVNLEHVILKAAIPMKGRLIHTTKGETKKIPYDSRTGQCIYSISRNYLNGVLLTEAEKYSNVKMYFNHKLVNANLEDGTLALMDLKSQKTEIYRGHFIIGADGAFSTLRRSMQQTSLFDFSQTYIKHGYLELTVPAENSADMIPNHLHIWPRNEFMMIALPNEDRSWTVTLFMPFDNFKNLDTSAKLKTFFQNTFPDALSLIGEEYLVRDFFKAKPSSLISIKCNPYHAGNKFLIIGDAAHAMVPFFGQGMNAGFEDCVILDDILTKNKDNIERSIEEFSNKRIKDANAICELAMYNYVEMRALVTRRSYHLRKFLDDFLFKMFPNLWIPLYHSVTFTDTSYDKCVQNRKWQDKIVERTVWLTTFFFIAMVYITIVSVNDGQINTS